MNGESLIQALIDDRVWVLSKRANGGSFRKIVHLFGGACIRYDTAIGSLYLGCEVKGLTLYPGNMGERTLEYGQVWGLLGKGKGK